ncbi:transporter substrate-binding protein [Candidatus Protochlamydia phocaeensis]|uniref:transporter substrate-binding protein n=1 Tax=Candidatus Protochlamydia phocaeensis TaxID=1414722 RepID=UPI000837D2AE|nr:transporter substrate-binding protein [Candidatus Protochlamydia phocaeensis]
MKLLLAILFILLILLQISIFLFDFHFFSSPLPPFKVGLLYSTSGFRSNKETPALQAALMAIDEINQKGGILGRKILPVIRDAQSEWESTEKGIESLILEEKVAAIFGGWTHRGYYAIKELIEKHQHLLINPFQYDGIISSPHLIWIGISLNQQVAPTIAYCMQHIGQHFFLVGSDMMNSHIIHVLAKDQIALSSGKIVGEIFAPLHEDKLDSIVQAILKAKPDVILCSLIGNENALFFKKLKEAGITAEKTPTFSFTLTEVLLENIDSADVVGNYATWNYFESIDNPLNHQFVPNFLKFSQSKHVDSTSEASYLGINLWAQAVREAQTTDIRSLRYIFDSMLIDAPEGPVFMDVRGLHAWRHIRIGKVGPDKQFDIIWTSKSPIRPTPFQIYHSQEEWKELTEKLYNKNP